jgi:DNA invertase Pin-like site-specific DNA recombinase
MKPYFKTRSEIANDLGISRKTLYRKLKENKIELGTTKLVPLATCEKIKKLLTKDIAVSVLNS